MRKEYEWVSENLNPRKHDNICRAYMEDTANKPWEADILRCKDPDNIPEFKVQKEPFAAVVKVCQSKEPF